MATEMLQKSEIPLFREVVELEDFIEGTETRKAKLILRPHHGQQAVLDSIARWVMMFGGTQVGKTCIGVHWLLEEIKKCGAGDYIVVTATYPLLKMKLLPEFLEVFHDTLHLGKYASADRVYTFSPQGEVDMFGAEQKVSTRIIFGSAENPESLESATALAAWCDEIGQKQFRRDAWEAVLRRLSLHRGRVLGTTTLYTLGWLKVEVYDKWKAGDKSIEVIQVDSVANPAFPLKEYLEAEARLPKWKFNLFYRGIYDKPAGLIYDCFDDSQIVSASDSPITKSWMRYVGHDFGGVHPAVLFYARDPLTGDLWLYREYTTRGKDAAEQVIELQDLTQDERIMRRVGGSHQEEGWRQAYSNAGWKIYEPRTSQHGKETQIDKTYGLKKQGRLWVLDCCKGYIDENSTFSRKLDDRYEPTEEIEDEARFHFMAAERYVVSDFLFLNPVVDEDEGYPQQKFY